MRARHALAALLLLTLAPVPPREARAETCPSGTLCLVDCRTNDLAVQDTSESVFIRNCGLVQLAAGYDLGQGTIHASVAMPLCNPQVYSASADGHDLFRIFGLPAGTPMSFTVELLLHVSLYSTGSSGSDEGWRASLTEGDFNSDSQGGSILIGTVTEDRVLRITVPYPAGTPFRLAYYVQVAAGQAQAGSSVSGTIAFPDLPPGAYAASCHNFGAIWATPARPVSWGAMKIRYR